MSLCIGLFGTCGSSTWRQRIFIPEYEKRNIPYFNPQTDDWNFENIKNEAYHLATDQIILFPITNETYGLGSLSEIGFSILNAIRLNDRRDFIILIDPDVDTSINFDWDEKLVNESLKLRELVKQHLFKLNYSNIYYVQTLEEMLELSIVLYENRLRIQPYIERFSLEKLKKF